MHRLFAALFQHLLALDMWRSQALLFCVFATRRGVTLWTGCYRKVPKLNLVLMRNLSPFLNFPSPEPSAAGVEALSVLQHRCCLENPHPVVFGSVQEAPKRPSAVIAAHSPLVIIEPVQSHFQTSLSLNKQIAFY